MRLTYSAVFSAIVLACSSASFAQAGSRDALKAAAQKAVTSNPEITARFNAYRAADEAVDAARGAYYPRLDLNASVGRDRDRITSRNPADQSLNRHGASLTLTQLLWDGLATQRDVGRLGHERMARYFDVLEATEQTALEAARAYYDVLRFRRLVQLAEDNFVQHQSAFNQIQSRYKAGVGRGVDLEQAGARLALAESNLNTELANLHDVSARYLRIVGEAPAANLPLPEPLSQALPTTALEASNVATQRSNAVSASIESVRAARAQASAREGSYQPQLQARLRGGAGRNFDGVRDQTRDGTAEIVLNWNLFNGGSDLARVRQQAHVVNQTMDLRDKACRDTRQTVAIAYNDTRKLVDQLRLLDRNTLAIIKARDAYRQQFEIGQRSLLDLLNAENEVYTAQRAYANAEYDLQLAYARAHAGLSQLGSQLGLTRADTAPVPPDEHERWAAGDDGAGRCPAQTAELAAFDTTALQERAARQTPNSTQTQALPTPVVQTQPLPPAKPAPATAAEAAGLSVLRLNDWAAAWQAKDVPRYLAFYAPQFTPEQGSLGAWKARRQTLVGKRGPISVKISDVLTNVLDANTVETRFQQVYRSKDFNDAVTKVLTWQRLKGEWLIVKESNR